MEATMEMLDEKALRRVDFHHGHRLTLSDGQPWFIPNPDPVFVPDDSKPGGIGLEWAFGEAYGELVRESQAAPDVDAKIAAEMKIFAFLLRQNYDLTPEQLRRILRVNYSDGAGEEAVLMRASLRGIAYGGLPSDPKAKTAAPSGSGAA